MTRLVRPSDIEAAVEWYTGNPVVHGGGQFRKSERQVKARHLYWAVLRAQGMSYPAIAALTDNHWTSVRYALNTRPPAQCFIDGVLERAAKQIEAEG